MKRSLLALVFVAGAVFVCPQGDDPQVDRILRSAKERQSTQNDVWFKLGDYPRTIQNLKFMAEQDPSDYETVTSLGWLLFSTERYSEEWATYTRFARMNPEMPDGALPLGEMLFNRKVWSAIPPLLEPRMQKFEAKLHPNNFRFLGLAYQRLGDLPAAIQVFEAGLRVHPEDIGLQRNLRNAQQQRTTPPPASGSGEQAPSAG